MSGRHNILIWLIAAVLPLVAAGCRDTDGPADILGVAAEIVTFEGNDPNARFSLQQVDDSPVYTLTGQEPVTAEGLEPGCRVCLRFVPLSGQVYASGQVQVLSVSLINQDTLRVPDDDGKVDPTASDPIYLYSLWRTGSWVNIYCRLPYDPSPRYFMMLLDPATAASEMPDIYLYHRTAEPVNSFGRNYYASFDISALWQLPRVKGVRVHVKNSNLTDLTVFTLTK